MARRARDRPVRLADQVEEASLELEQAERALRYRRSQLEAAKDELESLSGVAGWIPALLGRRGTYMDEAHAKIKALTSEILRCRKRLIEARQVRARLQVKQDQLKAVELERDDELERYAARIRETHHPLGERLAELEAKLEDLTAQIELHDAATRSTMNLRASMTEIQYRAGRMKSASLWDVFGSDALVDLHSTKKAKDKLLVMPQAVAQFNDACLPLGLEPLHLEFPEISYDWDALLRTQYATGQRRARHVLAFCDSLDDVGDLVQQTALWIGRKRGELQERYEALLQERRALLDDALG